MVFPVVTYGCESWTIKKVEHGRIDAFELWCWKDSWESLGLQEYQTSQSKRKSTLNINWKDWCWSWNSNTLSTWCEELTHWERPWCWERLKTKEEGSRSWDGWIASPINVHELGQTPGDSKGHRGLPCCSPWVAKSGTWQSNWTTTTGPFPPAMPKYHLSTFLKSAALTPIPLWLSTPFLCSLHRKTLQGISPYLHCPIQQPLATCGYLNFN